MEVLDKLIEDLTEEVDVRPKRIVNEGFQKASKLDPVKPDLLTRGQKKKLNKKKRESTAGSQWFDLPVKELTPEDKLTIDAMRLRETLDPTKFYKKKATDNIGRATRKERKQTLVDELIADAEFKKNVKKRYNRLRATDAIKKKEKALADRRRMMQGKKKEKKVSAKASKSK